LKIALLGDIGLFGKYSVRRGREVFRYFEDIAEYLSAFDYVVGNLETPLCEGLSRKGQKSAYINASPRNSELLNYLNISAVNLANNHVFDFGRAGYNQTTDSLEKIGVDYFGVDGREVLLRVGKARVAIHGYCSFNTNPLGVSREFGNGVNFLNLEQVVEAVKRHNRNDYLNIVSVHSGQEHVNYPSRDDIRMARFLSSYGPYVYYGHHPHVMQGYETCNDAVIAYSLGNFCFDDVYTERSKEPLVKQTRNNKSGLIAELEIDESAVRNFKFRTILADKDSLRLEPKGLAEALEEYCEALRDNSDVYDARRNALIAQFLSSRRNSRNLEWYMKRISLNSVGVIMRARINRFRYRMNVTRYLEPWT
jgi:poly-gamma-glutamate synthesis protein (capsule biosynthesis protein)